MASGLESLAEGGWSERRAAGRVRAALFDEVERPLLPRYVLEHVIGRGAMGEVWAARDPQLDRRVAIKLLLPSTELSTPAIERMAREARSLARLSHPNVVQIFDLGTYGSPSGGHGIFIVMELVQGEPLSAWITDARPWRRIVDLFADAGLGLAAAHDAGLVHRDFKPGNVLVGRDGRVRVGDFGLARLADASGAARSAALRRIADAEIVTTLAGDLTETGMVLGTPLYMSPEQHRGEPTDARSDQYSFCVALHEALHRTRPFAGDINAIVEAKLERDVAGARADLPGALHATILRGLEPDPAKRWSSMRELVGELRRIAAPGRGRVWLAAGVLATLGATIWLAATQDACLGTSMTRAHWDDTRRGEVRTALGDEALADLDRWTVSLSAAADAACAVDPARATGRWDCLSTAASHFDAVVDAITTNEDVEPEAAASLRLGLPDPSACAELHEQSPIPAHRRDEANELDGQLSQSHVLLNLGQYQAALALAESVKQSIGAVDTPVAGLESLIAPARYSAGAALWELLLYPEAEAEFAAAYLAAAEHGGGQVAWIAPCRLAKLTASQARGGEAEVWLGQCAAAIAGEPPSTRSAVTLSATRGLVAYHAARFDEAIDHYRAAIAKCDVAACEDEALATRGNLARVYTARHENERAAEAWRETFEHASQLHGPRGPAALIARAYAAGAITETTPGEALAEIDAVLAIADASRSTSIELVAEVLLLRAKALDELARLDEALATAERAIEVARGVRPSVPSILAFALLRAADFAERSGDRERALVYYDEALASLAPGDDYVRMSILVSRGLLSFDRGQMREGLADHLEALAIAERDLGKDHPTTALILANIAEAEANTPDTTLSGGPP